MRSPLELHRYYQLSLLRDSTPIFLFLLLFKCTDPLNPGKTINHPSINERPSLGDKKKKNVSGATGALSVLSERPISSSATSYHPQRPEETTEIATELCPAAAQSPLQWILWIDYLIFIQLLDIVIYMQKCRELPLFWNDKDLPKLFSWTQSHTLHTIYNLCLTAPD